ncbi:Protein of unknown function [Gryllus bimaculatus]|nr:Protein of unknown function [Gryllus bimaculatus]
MTLWWGKLPLHHDSVHREEEPYKKPFPFVDSILRLIFEKGGNDRVLGVSVHVSSDFFWKSLSKIMPKPGRRSSLDYKTLSTVILKHRDSICLPGGKLVSKTSEIWTIILKEVRELLPSLESSPKNVNSLYVCVSKNRGRIREKLSCPTPSTQDAFENVIEPEASYHDEDEDTDFNNATRDASLLNVIKTTSSLEKIDNFIMEKDARHSEDESFRTAKRHGEDIISEKLWNEDELKCAFLFQHHCVNEELTSGSFRGIN